MPTEKQNLILLIQPTDISWFTPEKTANLLMNRFCINEDAAFEVSGVHYLGKMLALENYLSKNLFGLETDLRKLDREELKEVTLVEGNKIEIICKSIGDFPFRYNEYRTNN